MLFFRGIAICHSLSLCTNENLDALNAIHYVQPMNYSSSSPGNYGGPPGSTGPPGPGTPIMPSPQDSSNSGGENMYTMMKPVPGGNMPGVSIRVWAWSCLSSLKEIFSRQKRKKKCAKSIH